MKYKTLVASTAEVLDEKVNELLDQGWNLHGPQNVTHRTLPDSSYLTFSQVMVNPPVRVGPNEIYGMRITE